VTLSVARAGNPYGEMHLDRYHSSFWTDYRVSARFAGLEGEVGAGLHCLLYSPGAIQTPRTPPQAFDGVHVFLRYKSAQQLYAMSVFRRDGQVAIKKKVPGGPVNGGEYATLAGTRHPLTEGSWNSVDVSAVDTAGGVLLSQRINGTLLIRTTDRGAGPPIAEAGQVGIRGDNADFRFRAFSATHP
jgi:hypothetical protein